uniref:Replication-associated protein n=1 Tax=Genomoviridae sp. TaxID=2202565 RepID=A0A858NG66_9VIRU|nr:MAG: replication-associated protein [Genomoviridae sp.]
MPFRFNAKRAFLTYPQCGTLTKELLLEFLRDDRGAAWYCVGLEQHEDGGNHLHAYAEWIDRLDVRDERHFDVAGQHPNIQSVRNRASVLKYCQKGGDYVGNCEATSSTTVRYGELIEKSRGTEEFLAGVIQHYPRDAVLHFERVQYFAEHYWRKESDPYISPYTSFVEPQGLLDWVSTNLSNGRPKSLVVISTSRYGKTEWARSLGEHMYFCGQFNLDDWNSDTAKYCVLDDFDIKYFPQWKSFLGCQREFVLTDKYRKKRTVKWGKPTIWLCNPEFDPRGALPYSREWLNLNCDFVELTRPLFNL